MEQARRLSFDALLDVPIAAKAKLLERLDRLRRAGDWEDLGCSLFDVVSRCHGEAEARGRLDALDSQLG
jgi:hypothetical protein